MKNAGLVSIIVPVYNAEEYLEECINSIVAQTYKEIEIILVNDGSNDSSLNILKKFEKLDSRVIVINQSNAGVTAARKKGVEVSTGYWILFSDADDIMPLDAIEKLTDVSDGYDVVMGHINFIGKFKWPYPPKDKVWTKKQALKRIVTGQQHCGPVAKLFSKKLFDDNTFEMPSDFVLGEDRIMNMNLITNIINGRRIRQIEEIVYTYIQRPTNHPSDRKNRKQRMLFECKILAKTSISLVYMRKFFYCITICKMMLKGQK